MSISKEKLEKKLGELREKEKAYSELLSLAEDLSHDEIRTPPFRLACGSIARMLHTNREMIRWAILTAEKELEGAE